jgi:serine/threonine protein kinase/Tol biopolymer transport system component
LKEQPDRVSRLAAALSSRYAIERELGAGGMATVYLAHDVRHDRKVALKVLRPELAAVLGADRFVQEIKTTASLQHPHILPLFDSGEADSFLYYVMPYIEGETLRDKLDREKQLGVDEAVKITSEIADALNYAHRNNVIHRDVKPENILLHDRRPMVADFGIALAVSAAAGGRMTETGLSLGTPHYMSPEQATAEKDPSNRSDIYSLGAVLYEMLTGDPPHTGSTAQQIIMKIVTEEARPLTELRKSVPPNVAFAAAKALEKLPADRFATAAEFSRALSDASFTTAKLATATPMAPQRNNWRSVALAASAVAVAALIFGFVGATRTAPAQPVLRVSVDLPEGQGLRTPWIGSSLTVSADGAVFAYLGQDSGATWQIWVRRRGELAATPISGTTSGTDPTLSPDGSEIAFTTGQPGPLKVATLASGAIRTVVDSAQWRGLAWADDGLLYFTTTNGGLARVPPDGGEVEVLTSPSDELIHVHPAIVPGSRGAVFEILDARSVQGTLAIVDFASGEIRELGPGTDPMFLPTGHLAWTTTSGELMAAPFDVRRLELTGTAIPIVDNVSMGANGGVHLAVSKSGTLIYRRGDIATRVSPVWVARDGTAGEVDPGREVAVIAGALGIVLSPDGARFVVPILGSSVADLWVRDASGNWSRFTFDGHNSRPEWTPDGESVAFLSTRAKPARDVWLKRADGSGTARRILTSDRQIDEVRFSHDGQWLLYRLGSGASRDLYAIRPGSDSVGTQLLATEYEERSASLSPNDRWMAYISNESGRDEIFVRPFPNATSSKWQVSTDGGTEPVWSRDGRELFYRNGNDDLIAVEITATNTFSFGRKRVLFSAAPYLGDPNHSNFDVHPDGERFLMLRNVSSSGGELIWVENWLEELKTLLDSN